MFLTRFAFVVSACAFARATTASAQDISGVVRDSVTGAPVRGAVVMILAADREPVDRRLSSSNGAFRVAVGSGTHIRVIRIGFLPFERPLNRLGASPLVVSLARAGRLIERVSVRANPVCPRRSDQREALSLWSAATDALLAVVVASADSQHTGLTTQILFNRLIRNDGRQIVRQSSRRAVTGNVMPIRADRDPKEFVLEGYVVAPEGGTTYYAPDPAVLLDSSFAASHCLSMRRAPRGDTLRIGVAFEPPYGRATPDIEGVLWLNRNPLELQSLEFKYSGVPLVVMNAGSGGRIEFKTLVNGVPFISSWHVRSPRLAFLRGRPMVAEVYETGGLIADGEFSDGTSFLAPLAVLRGRVSNIVSNQPVRDAFVTLDSTDQSVRTDSAGRFYFEQLLPGPHVLRLVDSLSIFALKVQDGEIVPDSSAVMQWVMRTATSDINVQLGFTPFVETALPWHEPLPGCGKLDERRFTVAGVVLTDGTTPVPNVPVQLSWADTSRGIVLETSVNARTDVGGGFIVCGIPSDRALGSRVVGPDGRVHAGPTRITRIQPDDDRHLPATIRAVTLRIPGR